MSKKALRSGKGRPTPKLRMVKRHRRARGLSKIIDQSAIIILERRYRVLEMRREGMSILEIQESLKGTTTPASVDTIRADIVAVLSMLAKQTNETAEEMRQLISERYDLMLKPSIEMAKKGGLAAMGTVLAIERDRRKMLALDVPEVKKLDITGIREYVGVNLEDV